VTTDTGQRTPTEHAGTALTSPPLLRVRAVSKSYGLIQALKHADFDIDGGEVVALIGENGSGKSTLVKILSGLVHRDGGEITILGKAVDVSSPDRSREAGVAVVQQELSLVPTLSAAENVFLGSGLSGSWGSRRLHRLAAPHLQAVGLSQQLWSRPVERLTVAERQLVEIARVIARDARIIILDEPTAALSDVEIARVHQVVRALTADGRAVIYVTHRMREIFELADRIAVVRGGTTQNPIRTAETTMDALIERMLGQSLRSIFPSPAAAPGPTRVRIRALEAPGLAGPVELTARRGEIVGIAGQIGSGAPQVLRSLCGTASRTRGTVTVDDVDLSRVRFRSAVGMGIGYCSSDRKRDGLFLNRTVRSNLVAPALKRVCRYGWYSSARAGQLAVTLAEEFSIAADKLDEQAGSLSGGNQQKVALGKWLAVQPRLLLVEEPTRGVDIGARSEIYAQLRTLADNGMTVVFASSDLPEVLGLSDTVVTMYRGAIVATYAAAELSEQQLMLDVTHGSSGDSR
jgi:ribose transport system ATP-binding protein